MQMKAGVCYHTAGVNYETAGVCCSVTANEQRLWQSATLGGRFLERNEDVASLESQRYIR